MKVINLLLCYLVFILVKGVAAFVLPRFGNKAYKIIEHGELFGHSELATD
jgi:hypothetical protein